MNYQQPWMQGMPPMPMMGAYPPMPPAPMQAPVQAPMQAPIVPNEMIGGEEDGQLPLEQSYIENILRMNRGKHATVFMSFEGGEMQEFRGVIEAAGRDHIILSDPETGRRYLLLMVYLNYIVFDEELEYAYPFNNLATYPPR